VFEHFGDLGENEFLYGIRESTAEVPTDQCSRLREKRPAGCVRLMTEHQAHLSILCREISDL